MRFFVQVEPSMEAGNKLDAGPGGPGPLFGYIAEKWKPEAFFVQADRRVAFWIIDFRDNASLTEFTHVALARAGAYPHLRPILTADEAASAIPKAIEQARRAP